MSLRLDIACYTRTRDPPLLCNVALKIGDFLDQLAEA